ncbi:MAG: L,D-transpeptidase family protein, partial [Hyphomicrobiaceae bacterium]
MVGAVALMMPAWISPVLAQGSNLSTSTRHGRTLAREIILARSSAVHAARNRSAQRESRALREAETSRAPAVHYAIVSLGSQRISVFGAKGRLHSSRVSTGKSGHRTPTGVFSILQRRRYHESNLYSDAPMPYMQRLTWSGIALHEGYVPNYPASHGCIRLPGSFARQLWRIGSMGMRVIVSPRDIKPVPFQHASLPTPMMHPRHPGQIGVQVAAADTSAVGAFPMPPMLSPYEYAEVRLEKAKSEKAKADRAVKPAYALAKDKSSEARRLAEGVKASDGIVTDAREVLAIEQFGISTVQTEEAEAPIRERIKLAKAAVKAAELAHTKLSQDAERVDEEAFAAAQAARDARAVAAAANEELSAARRSVKPISVFVSRQTGAVYVRQGSRGLAQLPISIAEPDKPLGTHVFLVTDRAGESGVLWVSMTVPTSVGHDRNRGLDGKHTGASTTTEELDRISWPEEVANLMSDRLWPGAAIIV